MLSLILLQQIAQLFIIIFLGWAIVKAGILKSEDSKTLSMVLLYIITPCDPECFSDRAHNGYRTHDGAFASICTDDERAESRAGKTVGKAVLPKYSGNSLCHVLELHQHGGSACHRNFW